MTRLLMMIVMLIGLALPATAWEVGDRALWNGAPRAKVWADHRRVYAPAVVTLVWKRRSGEWWAVFDVGLERRQATVRVTDLLPMAAIPHQCRHNPRRFPPGHPLCRGLVP